MELNTYPLITELYSMEVTLIEHTTFPLHRVLKLLSSHKCHCSHPVQICDSNHTHIFNHLSIAIVLSQ